MALPMCISYAGLSLFIFKAGVILLRFMRLYAYNLTISLWESKLYALANCGSPVKSTLGDNKCLGCLLAVSRYSLNSTTAGAFFRLLITTMSTLLNNWIIYYACELCLTLYSCARSKGGVAGW